MQHLDMSRFRPCLLSPHRPVVSARRLDTPIPVALLAGLETLPDPRSSHRRQHKLVDLVIIALGGVLCGADSRIEIAAWRRVKEPWLRIFSNLPAGIASHDTFSRVFQLLDLVALEAVLLG